MSRNWMTGKSTENSNGSKKKQKENIEFPVEFPSNLSKLQYA